MDQEPMVEEVIDNKQPVRQEPEPQVVSLDDMKVGFIVGVDPGGEWIFKPFGKMASLDSLLGCLYHAQRHLEALYDVNMNRGDKKVVDLGRVIGMLGEKVDQLASKLGIRRSGTEV